ncbi:MAG: inner-rane translocator, partial [Deltaproteobacteria bacterium]|nr:inner-rane translocator [Deltaproteobacteria bacterium]
MTARIASKALVVFLALVALLAVLPLLGLEGYHLRLLSLVFLWISLAGCWNFMSGYTGYIDFGPVAYLGAGADATAILMIRLDLPFPHSLALSGVICALLSAMIGWATLRIRGAYFAIATFAAAEALKQVSLEGDRVAGFEFFGGSHGLTLPPPPASEFFYYTLLGFLVLVVGISFFIEKTKFGYGLKAIRESELSAELSGVPTLALKVKAYILSSSLIGCLGGVEAYWLTYIIPDDVFNVMRTIQMVIMTLLGGMGTVWGPVIGAGFLTLVAEFLGAK